MFYLNAPDVNVSILETEDSALARLTHFATHNELNDELEYIKYLEISSLLDYAGFLCLRFVFILVFGKNDLSTVLS